MIGNAEVVAAGLEEIDPLKGTETIAISIAQSKDGCY